MCLTSFIGTSPRVGCYNLKSIDESFSFLFDLRVRFGVRVGVCVSLERAFGDTVRRS